MFPIRLFKLGECCIFFAKCGVDGRHPVVRYVFCFFQFLPLVQKAETVLNQWKELEKTKYVANYWMATVYAALGEKDAAFAELEKSYREHDWFFQRLRSDPFMDPLRDDPRFKDLVRRLSLPE